MKNDSNNQKWYDLPVWFVIYFFGIWFIFATISESDYPTIAKPIAAAFIAFCVIVSFHEREEIAREDERRKIEGGGE